MRLWLKRYWGVITYDLNSIFFFWFLIVAGTATTQTTGKKKIPIDFWIYCKVLLDFGMRLWLERYWGVITYDLNHSFFLLIVAGTATKQTLGKKKYRLNFRFTVYCQLDFGMQLWLERYWGVITYNLNHSFTFRFIIKLSICELTFSMRWVLKSVLRDDKWLSTFYIDFSVLQELLFKTLIDKDRT